MRILVTGACGFIGYHLVKKLQKDSDFEIHGIDNLNEYYDVNLKELRLKDLEQNKFFFHKIDIRNINELQEKDFDVLINLAAQAGTRLPSSNFSKYVDSNLFGFFETIDFAKKNSINNFINASSSSIYSSINNLPFSEKEQKYQPENFYGLTKHINEKICKDYSINFEMKVASLRFFTVYGPYGRPDMAYFKFIKSLINNEEIPLINNGETYRDMTYIDDIVSGIIACMFLLKNNSSKSFYEDINLGNNEPIKTLEMLEIVSHIINKPITNVINTNVDEIMVTHANISKAKSLLNYSPSTSIRDGLSETTTWIKSYLGV